MSNVLGVRDRPGPTGSGNIAAGGGTFELQDYRVSFVDSKITYWIGAPAAGRLDVFRFDPAFGPSGVPGGTRALQSFVIAASTFETPVSIDSEVGGGGSILRAIFTDTSGAAQNGITTRVGERRAPH